MIYMLLGTGFEETEAIAPLDLLRRAGVSVATVGLNGKTIRGSHNIRVEADLEISQLDLTTMEGIILPGGLGGVASIRACQQAMDAIRFAWENQLLTAAICAGPTVLADLGITEGKRATCFPGQVGNMKNAILEEKAFVRDGKIITGASAGCAVEFGLALIEALRGAEASELIRKQIVIR